LSESTYSAGVPVPYLYPTYGADQFSSYFGTKLTPSEDLITSWASPSISSWEDAEIRLRDEKGGELDRMIEFLKYAAQRSEGKYLISMIDLHSNMDCLSAMRGPEQLCMDLADYPDEIEKAMIKIRSYYKPIYERLFKAGEMDKRGSLGWAPFNDEGKFATMQCDYICMLGPEHARKYVIPALEEEAAYLDHSVYHFDGKDALRHLDDILAIKDIDVIQWVPGAGQPRTVEWMDLLKKIQKAGKGLHLYDWTIDEIKHFYKELRPEGLMFQLEAKSPSEADELLEFLVKNT